MLVVTSQVQIHTHTHEHVQADRLTTSLTHPPPPLQHAKLQGSESQAMRSRHAPGPSERAPSPSRDGLWRGPSWQSPRRRWGRQRSPAIKLARRRQQMSRQCMCVPKLQRQGSRQWKRRHLRARDPQSYEHLLRIQVLAEGVYIAALAIRTLDTSGARTSTPFLHHSNGFPEAIVM